MDEKNINNLEELSENEIDPRLHFDAFMGGVKDGGLRSVNSIYLLICYIVENVNEKVTAEIILQAMNESGIANYFEVSDAIDKLKKSGTIIEGEDKQLSLNKNTGAEIELVEKDLPYTIRSKSVALVHKIIAKERFRRENSVEIEKSENSYFVNMIIGDKDTEFMRLKLFAATYEQAEIIKEKFISNPAKVYEAVINGIFQNEE